jgi:hypothetical protein
MQSLNIHHLQKPELQKPVQHTIGGEASACPPHCIAPGQRSGLFQVCHNMLKASEINAPVARTQVGLRMLVCPTAILLRRIPARILLPELLSAGQSCCAAERSGDCEVRILNDLMCGAQTAAVGFVHHPRVTLVRSHAGLLPANAASLFSRRLPLDLLWLALQLRRGIARAQLPPAAQPHARAESLYRNCVLARNWRARW